MKINKMGDVLGVVPQEDIVEGRMVLLTSNVHSYDFGSREDLPGVKLPDNATEAAKAKYCLTFAVTNAKGPFYEPTPHYDWAERYGFAQTANVPFSATVHLTAPSLKEGETIPSGSAALAFAGGVYTVPSGAFVYSSSLVPGAFLTVADASTDGASEAGKLKYSASAGVAIVERYDSANGTLTFRTLVP